MVEEVVRIVLLDDLPLVHENHAIGHGLGEAHFMCYAQHGDALARHLDHHIQHFLDHFRVERRRRLIEQHDLGRQAQGTCDGDALLLAARKLQRILAGLFRDTHPLQLHHRLFFGVSFRHLADPHRRQRQIFQHREMRKQVELLKNHADFFAHVIDCLDVVGQFDAVHEQMSLLVFLKPVDTANQGGLAGARGAANNDTLAGCDVQIDIPQHMEIVAVPLVEFFELDDRFCHDDVSFGVVDFEDGGAQRSLLLLTCFSTHML